MKVTVVSTNRSPYLNAIFAGDATADQIHEIALAFIGDGPQGKVRSAIRAVFGRWNHKSYCIDFSGKIRARMTFSVRSNPATLEYHGTPVAVAPRHASDLEVYISTREVNRFEASAESPRTFSLGD